MKYIITNTREQNSKQSFTKAELFQCHMTVLYFLVHAVALMF